MNDGTKIYMSYLRTYGDSYTNVYESTHPHGVFHRWDKNLYFGHMSTGSSFYGLTTLQQINE